MKRVITSKKLPSPNTSDVSSILKSFSSFFIISGEERALLASGWQEQGLWHNPREKP